MNQNYLSPTNLYDEAWRRYKELLKQKETIEKKISKYPKGKIHIVRTNNRTQFYIRTDPKDKSGKYIPKKQTTKIHTFLQKRYEEKVLGQISDEADSLGKFLRNSAGRVEKIQETYSQLPIEIRQFVNPIDVTDDDIVKAWQSINYEKKKVLDGSTVFISDKGDRVRSKSELNIANALYKYGIPYKYECPLDLGQGFLIYPDFTIWHKKRRCEIYWEHRGMMDDREYARHAVIRMRDYSKKGFFVGDRLIITEETSFSPLGTNEISEVIKHFFA